MLGKEDSVNENHLSPDCAALAEAAFPQSFQGKEVSLQCRMPRMPECVPTSGLSTTRNRRLLIEVDLTAVERLQRVNSGLQTFVRSGHNFPTMKPLD